MDFAQFLGGTHPLVIHFPIALLFAGVAFDLYGWLRQDEKACWAGQALVVMGTIGAMFSFVTGSFAEVFAARAYIPQEPMEKHEGLATVTSWLFIGLVAFRSFLSPLKTPRLFKVYLLAAGLGLVALTATGYQGGKLVYEFAAGVQGVKPPFHATDADLAVLSQSNSADELKYSEVMHHVFGVMVLALALWLTWQEFDLPFQEKVRALGPVALMAGGVFLMIFSDFDSWPLSDIKPITDREVLAHKLIATMMILVGMGASFVRRKESARDVSRLQNHLVAVLALAGGGILFTHVHTTAPYSDVAVGVYLHHLTLGTVALLCGGVKIMDLSLPEGHKFWSRAWIVLLFVVSGLLLGYTEGIPWYLGGTKL